MVLIVDRLHRQDFDGLSGVVSEHVPAKPKSQQAGWSSGCRPRVQPRPVLQDDLALRASSLLILVKSNLPLPVPVIVTKSALETDEGRR